MKKKLLSQCQVPSCALKKSRTLPPTDEGNSEACLGLRPLLSSLSTQPTPKPKCSDKLKKRNYDASYLSFGFTYAGHDTESYLQCVICLETLSNHSMKPSLLKQHFQTKQQLQR